MAAARIRRVAQAQQRRVETVATEVAVAVSASADRSLVAVGASVVVGEATVAGVGVIDGWQALNNSTATSATDKR